VLNDALVTSARAAEPPGRPLRTAAIGRLAFAILYLAHRLLQGNGPDSASPPAVAAY
jgi:hypothetical protein